MNITLSSKQLLVSLLPLVIIGSSLFLALTMLQEHPKLAIGITYDLTIFLPIVYLIAIRNTSIPRITAIPVTVAGFVIASLLIPDPLKTHLNYIETFFLPVLELLVVGILIYKVRKTILVFRSNRGQIPDFYLMVKQSAREVLKKEVLANVMASEISMFYYAFFAWKRRAANKPVFSYHRNTGSSALFGVIIFLILVETAVLHILLMDWSLVVAWVLSGLSIYSGIQLLGHARAMLYRPHTIQNDYLILNYGLFGHCKIERNNIESVRALRLGHEEKAASLSPFSVLEGSNVLISFKKTVTLEKIYGLKKQVDSLAIHVDDREEFIRSITL